MAGYQKGNKGLLPKNKQSYKHGYKVTNSANQNQYLTSCGWMRYPLLHYFTPSFIWHLEAI